LPGALDLLRSLRTAPDEVEIAVLAATDPANPYGAALKWTRQSTNVDPKRGPTRTVGATVILVDGTAAAYLSRGDRQLTTWLPEVEPERTKAARAVSQVLIDRARSGGDAPRGMLIEEIDALPAGDHPLAQFLIEAGFVRSALGIVPGRRLPPSTRAPLETAGGPPKGGRRVTPHRSLVSSPFARQYFDDSTED